jgi:heptosyltransferase-2
VAPRPESAAGGGGPLLLRLPNWLGDLVLALPVVEAAAARPGAPPLFVGPAAFASLLTPRAPHVRYHAWSRGARYALAPVLRRERPASALLLTESFSSALLALLSGAPVRIGFDSECRGPLLTRRVRRPAPPRGTPRVREYRILAEAAGIAVPNETPRLRATPAEREGAEALLARSGRGGDPYAVLAPGASYGPAKRWPADRFAALARSWQRTRGLRVVLVGVAEDRPAAQAVAASAESGILDLTGLTDLPQLVGVLDGAAAVASNDSGVMHLAAALGRPTVAVFGSTSPVWTSAAAGWVRNLYAAYPCSPCFRRTCPIGYGCLKAIDVGEAARASEELMARGIGETQAADAAG